MKNKKINLYIYPNAKPHDHDTNVSGFAHNLVDTVPMSKIGIERHFNVCAPEEADYFFMGQFAQDSSDIMKVSPADYKYFKGNENKHICDLDGEGGFEYSNRNPIPTWLHRSIITANGIPKTYSNIPGLFPRPTFSQLLIDIIKNQNEQFDFPKKTSIGSRVYLNHKIRALTAYVLHKSSFNKELHLNKIWHGLTPIGTDIQKNFIETMLNNSISLCPRGSGIDSVRFYETCYFMRLPVIITDQDYYLLGEDRYDTSFCFRICDSDMKPSFLKEALEEIYNLPIEVQKEHAVNARVYFDTVVREYFADPTLYFLKWMNSNERK